MDISLTCERCGKEKADVRWRLDPYDQDVNNKEVWEFLCDDCECDLMDDI